MDPDAWDNVGNGNILCGSSDHSQPLVACSDCNSGYNFVMTTDWYCCVRDGAANNGYCQTTPPPTLPLTPPRTRAPSTATPSSPPTSSWHPHPELI